MFSTLFSGYECNFFQGKLFVIKQLLRICLEEIENKGLWQRFMFKVCIAVCLVTLMHSLPSAHQCSRNSLSLNQWFPTKGLRCLCKVCDVG
jgi:hypothetical protein